ncbi:hypothetical protein SLA2020_341960 [Shorea laevis]
MAASLLQTPPPPMASTTVGVPMRREWVGLVALAEVARLEARVCAPPVQTLPGFVYKCRHHLLWSYVWGGRLV